MRENIRRPLLFLITVGTGSLIIIADAPVEVIIAGTVVAGFLALLVTGALDLEDLKPSRLRSGSEGRQRNSPKATDTQKPASTAEKPSRIRSLASAEINLPGMFGTLAAAIRETIAHARTPEAAKKKHLEKIDAVLDQTVDGAVPDLSIAPVPPKAGGKDGVDPLASLAALDLDSLEDLDLDGEASGPGTAYESDQISLLSGEDADAVAALLKTHESDLDDLDLTSGIELPADPAMALPSITAGGPELPGDDGMPDLGALSEELSTLDDLDPGEIETGDEEEEPEAAEPVPVEEVVPEEEAPKEDFDMVSFASGGMVDDDLIAALKSDVKKKKFVEDISLVRELKGEKYHAEDLAAELEDVLVAMKAR